MRGRRGPEHPRDRNIRKDELIKFLASQARRKCPRSHRRVEVDEQNMPPKVATASDQWGPGLFPVFG